jgi:hypothetical protein
MKSHETQLTKRDPTQAALVANREVQFTWFEVSRDRQWRSLSLVPVEPALAVYELALSFGALASERAFERVLVINASLNACAERNGGSPRPISEIWAAVAGDDKRKTADKPYDVYDLGRVLRDEAEMALASLPQLIERLDDSDKGGPTTIILALDSPLQQPRAVPVARATDKVAICARLGSSTVGETRRLVELVGRERVLGSIVVKPRKH